MKIAYQSMNKMKFPAEKQTAIRLFAGDSISHIVIAVRIGLWGALPEGLSVLRGGIESCAQLAHMVNERLYRTAICEAQKLSSFRQLEFDRACKKLGILGANLLKLHSQISGAAGHSTGIRLSLLEYDFQGQEYDRLGFAFEPQNARLVAHHCILVASLVVQSLRVAHMQDGASFEWDPELTEVLKVIESLRTPSQEPKLEGASAE